MEHLFICVYGNTEAGQLLCFPTVPLQHELRQDFVQIVKKELVGNARARIFSYCDLKVWNCTSCIQLCM